MKRWRWTAPSCILAPVIKYHASTDINLFITNNNLNNNKYILEEGCLGYLYNLCKGALRLFNTNAFWIPFQFSTYCIRVEIICRGKKKKSGYIGFLLSRWRTTMALTGMDHMSRKQLDFQFLIFYCPKCSPQRRQRLQNPDVSLMDSVDVYTATVEQTMDMLGEKK